MAEHLLLLPYCGKPSKKHFVELSAYLIKCNMDMSEHTWQRLTYWAAVLPVLSQLSVYTRTLTLTHAHTRMLAPSRSSYQMSNLT